MCCKVRVQLGVDVVHVFLYFLLLPQYTVLSIRQFQFTLSLQQVKLSMSNFDLQSVGYCVKEDLGIIQASVIIYLLLDWFEFCLF